MIEYVALGDYEAAVGHLLASAPDKSARYYRDALCTLALAARPPPPPCAADARWQAPARRAGALWCCLVTRLKASLLGVQRPSCSNRLHAPAGVLTCRLRNVPLSCIVFRVAHGPPQPDTLWPPADPPAGAVLRGLGTAQAASAEAPEAVPAGAHEQVSRTLHIQAAKVVAANAATIGDALLAVPLLCSAGAARPARPPLAWGAALRALPCAAARSALPRGAFRRRAGRGMPGAAAWRARGRPASPTP